MGLYVHGSVALGCFQQKSSDIDYVCVVESEPDDAAKRRLMDETIALEAFAPETGLEMHVLLREDCLHPRHPVRFSLHYSPMHTAWYFHDPDDYVARMKGKDPDLAAHLTVLHERGLRWDGPPVREIFGAVPRYAYLDSVLADVSEDSDDPVYRVLNLCRVLGYLGGAGVLSKKEGGEWFLGREENALVREALACYADGMHMTQNPRTQAFCTRLVAQIQRKARVFSLEIEPFTTDAAWTMLAKAGVAINEYARRFIEHSSFPWSKPAARIRVICLTLREIGFPDGAVNAEIAAKLPELGLMPCSPCSGLFLRLAWWEQQASENAVLTGTHRSPDGAVTVWSEPLEQDDGFPKGLYLRNVEGTLWLRGYVSDAEHRWSGEDMFAFATYCG